MKVLHLSSSYPYTDLYKNLLAHLDLKGIEQLMYVAIKDETQKNKRVLENPKSTEYIFSSSFNKFDSYVYYSKIRKIYQDINLKLDLEQFDLTHAHFLFSDGGIAYKIKKDFHKEYIVAVRNSDVNFFFKYGLHIRNYGIRILKEAKKIIFISPTYKDFLFTKYVPKKLRRELNEKTYVIPNGVDYFWLQNINYNKKPKSNLESVNLVFTGELNKNKNIINSLKAVKLLVEKGYKVNFDIIGTGPLKKEVIDIAQKKNIMPYINLHGYIYDREKIINIYRRSDIFLMPSYKETFGLVYIEAMTQGLPVIYSKGQGIDGYFHEGDIGFHVTPENTKEIVTTVEKILYNYKNFSNNCLQKVDTFSWAKITDNYISLYKDVKG